MSKFIQLPPGYKRNLELEYDTISTVKVKTGECRDEDDAVNMYVESELTLDITSSGDLGLDTGSEAVSTWYAV